MWVGPGVLQVNLRRYELLIFRCALSVGIEHSDILTKHARRPLLSLKPGMGPHSAHVPDVLRRMSQILLAHPSAGKSETSTADTRCALTHRSRAVRRVKSGRHCGARAPTPAEPTVPLAQSAGTYSHCVSRRRATTFCGVSRASAKRESTREHDGLRAPRTDLRLGNHCKHTSKGPRVRGSSPRS